MLDSNPWSTVNRIECRSYSNPLTVTTDSSSSACQYWIPLSRFSKGYVVYNNRKATIEFLEGYYPNTNATATTLEFRDVVYPKTFKIDTQNGWSLKGGYIVSDKQLSTLSVKIIKENGDVISQMASPRQLTGKRFYVSSLDGEGKDNGQKFSKITTAGNYLWIMTATDSGGRSVTIEMPITAVTSGSTVTDKMSSTNSSPSLTETPLNGIYRFKKDDDCRSGPGEAYSKIADQSTGDIIFVVASVVNQYNNTWYKTDKGYYVYSGDVEKVTLSETTLSGTYVFNKNDESRTWPYEASKLVTSYSKGNTVQVAAKVTNTYGNVWYKLSTGAYVYSGDLDSASTVSTLQFKNVVHPSVYIISASGWYLDGGTVESDYELTSIKSEIKKGSTVISTKTRTISGKSYTIKNLETYGSGSEDNGVRFSYIKNKGYGAGSYTWELTATDAKGRALTLSMPFEAKTSGTNSNGTTSLSYNDLTRNVTAVYIEDAGGVDYTNGDLICYGYDNTSTSFVLVGRVNPSDATNSTLTWSSSNESVVKLVSTENIEGGTIGYFSRTGVGSATITATAKDGSGKKATTSYRYYITNISLNATESTIAVNQYTSVVPTITPSVASYSNLTWSTSNSAVATVDNYGTVKGIGKGTATITAAASDGSGVYGTCTITVTSNISNLNTVMYESPYPTSDEEINGIMIHPILVGEVFTLYTSWDFSTYTSDYTCNFTLDNNSGLTAVTGQLGIPGSFLANSGGTWNVYFNLYENGYLVERLTIPITVVYGDRTLVQDIVNSTDIETAGSRVYWSFTPSVTQRYVYISSGNKDTIGYIYDSAWNMLAADDDSGDGNNFRMIYELEAGKQYYLGAKFYNSGLTGSVSVKLEKYRPVSYISYGIPDLLPGTTAYIYSCGIDADGYESSVSECYFEPIDNEVCSISESGFVEAKSNGLTGVTIHSVENPDITARAPIIVHGQMHYDYNVFVDSQGLVNLSFNSMANTGDKFNGFNICAFTLDVPFQLPAASIPGLTTKTEFFTWDGGNGKTGQSFNVFLETGNNIVTTNEGVTFCLLPDNLEELWGTTQQYTFSFSPLYDFEGIRYTVYGVSQEITITVSYPAAPYDFVTPNALKTIEDEAFYGIAAKRIKIAEHVTRIGSKAFSHCPNILCVYIPESCKTIANDAFDSGATIVIYGKSGSRAETYAQSKGFKFIAVK